MAEISQVKWKTQFYSRKREAEPCGLQAQQDKYKEITLFMVVPLKTKNKILKAHRRKYIINIQGTMIWMSPDFSSDKNGKKPKKSSGTFLSAKRKESINSESISSKTAFCIERQNKDISDKWKIRICRQKTHRTILKEFLWDWRKIIPDENLDLQEEIKGIRNGKYVCQ